MIAYKCDGQVYGSKDCPTEWTGGFPEHWLMIDGSIKNGLPDSHVITCDGGMHFCSRKCLENFLFKNEK